MVDRLTASPLQAIVVISQNSASSLLDGSDLPGALTPLCDRPWIFHIVEQLVRHGVTRIHFIASGNLAGLELSLGDGSRWNCSFEFHPVGLNESPYRRIAYIECDPTKALLVRASRICQLTDAEFAEASTSAIPTAFIDRADASWTGWGMAKVDVLKTLATEAADAFETAFLETCDRSGRIVTVHHQPLALLSWSALYRMHMRLMALEWAPAASRMAKQLVGIKRLLVYGHEIEPGIRICAHAFVSRRAQIEPPVFFGESARIEAGARVGPYAFIGAGSVIDEESEVVRSVVLPRTYLGKRAVLSEKLADGRMLVDPASRTAIRVEAPSILCAMPHLALQPLLQRIVRSLEGSVLLAVHGIPALVLRMIALIRNARDLSRQPVLQHYLDVFVPGLWRVAAGNLAAVGPTQLQEDAASRKVIPGLVSPAACLGWDSAPHEVRILERLYTQRPTFKSRLRALDVYNRLVMNDVVHLCFPGTDRLPSRTS